MSRSGYSDDYDNWQLIRWRGQVASTIRGKRGQAFLREMLAALDALPTKRLIASELELEGDVCALGSVGKVRGLDMSKIDIDDPYTVAGKFGLTHPLAAEIMWVNDEGGAHSETPEQRYTRVRKWIEAELIEWDTP